MQVFRVCSINGIVCSVQYVLDNCNFVFFYIRLGIDFVSETCLSPLLSEYSRTLYNQTYHKSVLCIVVRFILCKLCFIRVSFLVLFVHKRLHEFKF